MNKKTNLILTIFIFLSSVFCTKASQNSEQNSQNFEIVKLADGVYAAIVKKDSKAVSNSGFVILDNAVVVYDCHLTPALARELNEEIGKLTPKPIKYVIDSHFHGDHTGGNAAYENGIIIISTQNTRKNLQEKELPQIIQQRALPARIEQLEMDISVETDPETKQKMQEQIEQAKEYLERFKEVKLVLPNLTFVKSFYIHGSKRELDVLFLGRGHTDGDAFLYLPDEKIIFMGDLLFNQTHPVMRNAYSQEWIDTLEAIKKLGATTYVPGHGKVSEIDAVNTLQTYINDLRSTVKRLADSGLALDEIVAELVSEDGEIKDPELAAKYGGFEFKRIFRSNVEKVYIELTSSE